MSPLRTDLTNDYLKAVDRRPPAQEEYIWMARFGAHTAALFVALELMPYDPAAKHDLTSYLARARNHAEAIAKDLHTFSSSLPPEAERDQSCAWWPIVLDVVRAQHFQPAAEHMGLAIFGDSMREYERRVIFEATVVNNAKATATPRVHATLAWRGRGPGRGRDGGRCSGREGEHV
eukprot:jgi/Tetstr1/431329/TSEL_021020.t1